MRQLLPAFLALALFGGCTSARYQLTVGNDHPSLPVRDVRVLLDGRPLPSFPLIAPQKIAAAKPRSGDIPREILLRWMDAEGQGREVRLEGDGLGLPPDFRGQISLAITPAGQVTLTPLPSQGPALSAIPWAVPEQWEGSVFLPGMNE